MYDTVVQQKELYDTHAGKHGDTLNICTLLALRGGDLVMRTKCGV